MVIRNKYLKISNEDIRIERDSLKLRQWLIDIEENILCMDVAIDQAKYTAFSTGNYADRDWFTKITTASRLQKILKLEIEKRLEELSTNKLFNTTLISILKEQFTTDEWNIFLKVCKQQCDNETV